MFQNNADNAETNAQKPAVRGDVPVSKPQPRQLMDLEFPQLDDGVAWVSMEQRQPGLDDVMLIKSEGQEGWMGVVGALFKGRPVVALVCGGPNFTFIMPLIEDGFVRMSGMTHWRPWPAIPVPALVATLV